MKNLNKMIAVLAMSAFSTVNAVADWKDYASGFGIGVSGAINNIDGAVKETTTTGSADLGAVNTNSTNINNDLVPMASIYAEYSFESMSGLTIGGEFIPGSVDISDKLQKRLETPASGSNEGVATTFSANGAVENLRNFYIEVPIVNMMYAKVGYSMIDVITNESASIAKYGNESDIGGINLGLGIKSDIGNNLHYKLAYELTNFDNVTIKNTNGNSVSGDIDTRGIKMSLGYKF